MNASLVQVAHAQRERENLSRTCIDASRWCIYAQVACLGIYIGHNGCVLLPCRHLRFIISSESDGEMEFLREQSHFNLFQDNLLCGVVFIKYNSRNMTYRCRYPSTPSSPPPSISWIHRVSPAAPHLTHELAQRLGGSPLTRCHILGRV